MQKLSSKTTQAYFIFKKRGGEVLDNINIYFLCVICLQGVFIVKIHSHYKSVKAFSTCECLAVSETTGNRALMTVFFWACIKCVYNMYISKSRKCLFLRGVCSLFLLPSFSHVVVVFSHCLSDLEKNKKYFPKRLLGFSSKMKNATKHLTNSIQIKTSIT